jgi:hypothetical protein
MSDLDQKAVECPVEGCEYTNLKDNVASHYSGKKDDEHNGGYHHAKTLLEQDGPTDSTTVTSDTDDGGDELKFPENPDADDDDGGSGDPTECPDCGSENWAVASKVLRAYDLGPEETQALSDHERVCAECGEVYR